MKLVLSNKISDPAAPPGQVTAFTFERLTSVFKREEPGTGGSRVL